MDRVLFVGSKSTGFNCLASLINCQNIELTVATIDDRSDDRSYYLQFHELAEKNNLILETVVNNHQLYALVDNVKPDSIFVCGWYWILGAEIVKTTPKGIFGIHNSLLPKYRGHAPLVWSLINGDDTVGASLFRFDSGMDTGLVYHQWKVKNHGEYIDKILVELDKVIFSSLDKIYHDILNGSLEPQEQNHKLATYCSKRRAEDSLIDWEQSSDTILNFIRTLSEPYPESFTFVGKNKVFIKRAELFPYPVSGYPGQVVCHLDGYVVICCGDGKGVMVTSAIDVNEEVSMLSLFRRLSSPHKAHELNSPTVSA